MGRPPFSTGAFKSWVAGTYSNYRRQDVIWISGQSGGRAVYRGGTRREGDPGSRRVADNSAAGAGFGPVATRMAAEASSACGWGWLLRVPCSGGAGSASISRRAGPRSRSDGFSGLNMGLVTGAAYSRLRCDCRHCASKLEDSVLRSLSTPRDRVGDVVPQKGD